MSYPLTDSYKRRLDDLFAKGDAISDNETRAEWSKYLCVTLSGFLEVAIQETLVVYAKKHSWGDIVDNYVENALEGFQNPKMGKIIDLIRKFDKKWAETVEIETSGEISDHINSLVTNRHKIAHGESVGVSYYRTKGWYTSSKRFVDVIQTTCC